jgi:hypothetical protein
VYRGWRHNKAGSFRHTSVLAATFILQFGHISWKWGRSCCSWCVLWLTAAAAAACACLLAGAEGLAAILRSPAGQSLSTLNLSNNCFGDEAASQLAIAAATSRSGGMLAVLDLSCNWIGDEGAAALATMLQHHSSLTTLLLQKNRIRRGGIDVLVNAALAAQGPLQELRLDGNRAVDAMSRLSLQDLARVLAQRRQQGFASNSSRRVSAASAAAAAATAGADDAAGSTSCREVDSSSASSSIGGGSAAEVEEGCVSPRASKVARVGSLAGGSSSSRSSSSTAMSVGIAFKETPAAAGASEPRSPFAGACAFDHSSSSSEATAGPFAYATTAAATAAVDAAAAGAALVADLTTAAGAAAGSTDVAESGDPTVLFQVPVGFAERVLDRTGHSSRQRSYSFEHWATRKQHKQRKQQQQQQRQQDKCEDGVEANAALQAFFLQLDGSRGSSRSGSGILAGLFAGTAELELDSVVAAATVAAAGQASELNPALLDSLSGWLVETSAGAPHVVLPAELLKSKSGSSKNGSRRGSAALQEAVAANAAAAAAAAAERGGTSSSGISSEGTRGAVRLRVRCQGSRSRDCSRDGSACGTRFFTCSSGSEYGSDSGSESEGEQGSYNRQSNSSNAVSPTAAAARCAVRKFGSPCNSVVVAKAAAAAAAVGAGGAVSGQQRLSRFAPQHAADQPGAAPHASGATQPLI